MDQAKDPLLENSIEHQGKPTPSHRDWVICLLLSLVIGALCVYRLVTIGLNSWTPEVTLGCIHMVLLHGAVATCATFALVCHYLDTTPMTSRYRVRGNAHIPEVCHKFVHSGRWTTFTTWCNTLATCYFWLVTIACIIAMQDDTQQLPKMMACTLGVLWDINFPMGFFVNLIVSFVLLPSKKATGDFVGLWYMLQWRGQVFHNGYAIAVGLEAALVSPEIHLSSFPVIVLYGITYVLFSYLLFARTGVFHYFFLDPRWKFAPLGLFALLGLLTGLFLAGSVAISAASHSWLAKGLVMIAALATCTFRDSAAVKPNTSESSSVA